MIAGSEPFAATDYLTDRNTLFLPSDVFLSLLAYGDLFNYLQFYSPEKFDQIYVSNFTNFAVIYGEQFKILESAFPELLFVFETHCPPYRMLTNKRLRFVLNYGTIMDFRHTNQVVAFTGIVDGEKVVIANPFSKHICSMNVENLLEEQHEPREVSLPGFD